MKKQIFLIVMAVPFLLLFSCNKKEVFNPNKYIETESFQSGSSREVVKRFVYSTNNQLSSVWLKNENGEAALTFEYNKDKTIKKIISSENNEKNYAVLSYENQLITQVQYYENDKLAQESIFSRKEKKNTINKIENYVYDGFSVKKKSILADLLFADVKTMPELVRKNHKSGGKSLYSILNITYENENIHRVRLSYVVDNEAILFAVITYVYDDKKNPYYGLPYPLAELTGYSKNNVTNVMKPIENDPYKTMIIIENNYSYEKKYPVYKSVIESETYIIGYDTLGEPIWNTTYHRSSSNYTYK